MNRVKIKDLEQLTIDSDVFLIVDKPPKRYNYRPKKDITTYELARLIPYLNYRESIEYAESDILRHFEEIK